RRFGPLPDLPSMSFFLSCCDSLRALHSFPTRRSSDLQWIKFMKDGVNATPLPTVNTTGYIDHAAFLGTINPDTNKIGMVNITSRDRKSGSAGMPRPISYAVFCLKQKIQTVVRES